MNPLSDKNDWSGFTKLLFTTTIVIFISYLAAAILLEPGGMHVSKELSRVLDCHKVDKNDIPKELFLEGQDCPSVTEEVINLESINFENIAYLKGTLRVWPAGEIGSALVNTGFSQRALQLDFDSLVDTSWAIPAKRFIGSRTFQVPLNNSSGITNYPFDRYSGTWSSFLEDFQTSKTLASTLTVSERPIYGWDLSVNSVAMTNDLNAYKKINLNGKQVLSWSASRSGSIKLSVILLVVVMMLGTISALILTKSIYFRRRPPTLSALGWLATSLFAILEIRNKFPGNPPLGISADLFVTYPVTVILLGLILVNTYFWINRDDWDMKNRPDEHSSI